MPSTPEILKTLAALLDGSWKFALALAIGSGALLFAPAQALPFMPHARVQFGTLLVVLFAVSAPYFAIVALWMGVTLCYRALRSFFTRSRQHAALKRLTDVEKAYLALVPQGHREFRVPVARIADVHGLLRAGIVEQFERETGAVYYLVQS